MVAAREMHPHAPCPHLCSVNLFHTTEIALLVLDSQLWGPGGSNRPARIALFFPGMERRQLLTLPVNQCGQVQGSCCPVAYNVPFEPLAS